MTGRLGIDFGTSNTVVTVWNESDNDSSSLVLQDYTRVQEGGSQQINVIPSLIHYAADFKHLLGNQVIQHNLVHSNRTFQWMKRYICGRSPVERSINGKNISHFDAGRTFLNYVFSNAADLIDLQDEEVALTVPVEAYEDYAEWLIGVVQECGINRFRLLDEPSAAALGYGAEVEPDEIYCVFDFGGGTLDVAIVILTESGNSSGSHCRILGKAGIELGGTFIDEWIYQEVLKRNGFTALDESILPISRLLLQECERLKEKLSFEESAELSVLNPISGRLVHATFTRTEFEELLDAHDAFADIDRTIRLAIKGSHERGYDDDAIKKVFLVGGGSHIPSVQLMLKRIFGKERVRMERPLDAVARGASAMVAGRGFRDFIQHDYAVRHVNPSSGKYEYRPIVKRGTVYPTNRAVATLTIKASFDGQKRLGVPIFELGGGLRPGGNRMELFFDDQGFARMNARTHGDHASLGSFWINESTPTFLSADPPAKKGEHRFRLEFGIDGNRRLLISAFDLLTSKQVLLDYPVAKLV